MSTQSATPPPSPPDAIPLAEEAVPLFLPEYAADPDELYRRLREFGVVAPVELSPDGPKVLLVTDYRAVLDVMQDTDTYSRDGRPWQEASKATNSPAIITLQWRRSPIYNDGEVHARYRTATVDCLSLVEPHELRALVHRSADMLIRRFAADGSVDLVSQYARALPLLVFNSVFGMSDEKGDSLVTALGAMMEGNSTEETKQANADFERYLGELIALKKSQRRQDVASWLMDHPAKLDEEELTHQYVMILGSGHQLLNLIANALSRMLSDDRYYNTVSGGALTPIDAINDTLRHDPPITNFSLHFPRHDVNLRGTWIPAGTPLLLSYGAANSAPVDLPADQRSDAGSHLAWGAGAHTCPAKDWGLLMATTAIERLITSLCDIELAVPRSELTWRPGPFHHALAALPARFTPVAPQQNGTGVGQL